MKFKVTVLTALVLLLGAWPLLAACPYNVGPFHAPADFDGGRISVAWCNGAGANEVGNTVNGMSWDGATLGGTWKMWGMELLSTTLTVDTVDANGSGIRVWHSVFGNGEFWLAQGGPWGGDGDLTGPIVDSSTDVTVQYFENNIVGATVNMSGSGTFADCGNGCLVDYAFGNAILDWMTGSPDTMPTDYPPFLCGVDMGELYTACCGTVSISCSVDSDQDQWGAIKSMYR